MTEARAEPRPRPTRADYVVWRQATTRWADDDVYGHMNNARYFELIDTAVNAHLAEATGADIRSLPAIGVVAEVSCRYFREVGYPRPVDLGLVVDRIGTSSVTYRIGIFQEGVADTSGQPRNQPGENQPGENQQGEQAAAEGRFVHVYVDNTAPPGAAGRSTRPVPDEIRAVLEPLLRR